MIVYQDGEDKYVLGIECDGIRFTSRRISGNEM